MPYISKETLYTDQNPGDRDWSGKVLAEGDEGARFVLLGAGSVLSDEDAAKYGLDNHKSTSRYDAAKAAEEREQVVVKHSEELAGVASAVQSAPEESAMPAATAAPATLPARQEAASPKIASRRGVR